MAALRHVLTSQLHRRFNPGRAATTTQRRLKRLSDAGLLDRFRFFRADGGAVPMCYTITPAGLGVLLEAGRIDGAAAGGGGDAEPSRRAGETPRTATRAGRQQFLRTARRDVHVVGWALALENAVGDAPTRLRGAAESVLSPPRTHAPGTHAEVNPGHTDGHERAGFGPADLRLPGGRVPHDFLRSDDDRRRSEVERFDTIRPDALVQIGSAFPAVDVFVVLDDRPLVGRGAAKLERYDHFVAGWSAHTRRYGRRLEAVPVVVFVCPDAARAREWARQADRVLCACRAYAGEYPFDWEYPGREAVLFAAERDIHDGSLRAFGVPALPPEVRVRAARGDPHTGETRIEMREIWRAGAAAVTSEPVQSPA